MRRYDSNKKRHANIAQTHDYLKFFGDFTHTKLLNNEFSYHHNTVFQEKWGKKKYI